MLAPDTIITIGILLLALVTVESGGVFLTQVVGGRIPANALQKGFYRAGHAHAAVLLILSIGILLVIDHAQLDDFWRILASDAVPLAAILMPAGFFLSVLGNDPQKPNKLIWLLWIGVASVTVGLLTSGVALIAAGTRALG